MINLVKSLEMFCLNVFIEESNCFFDVVFYVFYEFVQCCGLDSFIVLSYIESMCELKEMLFMFNMIWGVFCFVEEFVRVKLLILMLVQIFLRLGNLF